MTATLRTIGSHQVWVDDQGEGPAVIFIHGLGGTSNVFDAQAAMLATDHRVILVDLTGHGMSPRAYETSIGGWADDVLAILESCGVQTASIVAHSLGTIVAQRVIEQSPDRIERVVLLGPIRDLAETGRQAQRDRAALVRKEGMVAVAHAVSRGATSAAVQAAQPAVIAFVKELLQRI
jgi:3-oxoadipate enol-lactonase